MGASERVTRRMEATRQRIVDSAMELFLKQGFENTSVAQISEAADIGKGTFFTYFSTKHDVLSFLGEQVMEHMTAADTPEMGAVLRLRRIFDAAGRWFKENEAPARQMCIARLSSLGQQGVESSRGSFVALLESIVDEGLASGDFRAVPREAAVTMLASAYFVPVVQWTWEPEGADLSNRLTAQLDLALAALVA